MRVAAPWIAPLAALAAISPACVYDWDWERAGAGTGASTGTGQGGGSAGAGNASSSTGAGGAGGNTSPASSGSGGGSCLADKGCDMAGVLFCNAAGLECGVGVCVAVPPRDNCTGESEMACGCDIQRYPSICDVWNAGFDGTNADKCVGVDEFACGWAICKSGEYCIHTKSNQDTSKEWMCEMPGGGCMPPKCDCLEPGACNCTDGAGGSVGPTFECP